MTSEIDASSTSSERAVISVRRRDLERARKTLRDCVNASEAPYVSVYMPRTQARSVLAAVDLILGGDA